MLETRSDDANNAREQNMNTPELAVMRSGGEPGVGHLFMLRELGREEYEKYEDARRLVHTFVDSYMRFTMFRSSYDEYISRIHKPVKSLRRKILFGGLSY